MFKANSTLLFLSPVENEKTKKPKKLEAHVEKKMATQTTTQTRLSRRVISRRRERDKAEVAERRQNTEWHQRALLMHSACHRIQQQGRISHSSLHKTSPQQQQQQTHKRACARQGAVMQPHTGIHTCINIGALHVLKPTMRNKNLKANKQVRM